MEKFNELKDLVNASAQVTAASVADKQSNGADITDKPEFTQQPSVCSIVYHYWLFLYTPSYSCIQLAMELI